MSEARRDRPILVWHDHDSDPYYESLGPLEEGRLTVYGAHCEGLGYRRDKGYFVAVWGGGVDDDESGAGWGPWTHIPDWWFEDHSEFERPLAPVGFVDLTDPEFP
jgi:hypothetical protein